MRHWYLLAESSLGAHRHQCASDSAIIADRGRAPSESLSRAEREKMFWLGLVECAPLFIGGIFAAYADTGASRTILAAGAVAVTIIICWCLRHQTPSTRIEFTSVGHHSKDAKSEATGEV